LYTRHQILLRWSNQGGWDGRKVSTHGEMRNAYKILVWKPEGTRPCRWEDNIKIILEHRVGRCGLDLCGSGQVLVAGSCGHGHEPSACVKGRVFLDWLGDC
jgi:hypothetical protein